MNDREDDLISILLYGVVFVFALAFFLSAAGCASVPNGPPPCVTRCGIRMQAPSAWTCAELQAVEDVTVAQFARLADRRFATTCAAVNGWRLNVASVSRWQSPNHRTADNPDGWIAGVTYCSDGVFVVGAARPFRSSFAHEVAHVVQACDPLDHSNWGEAGIWDALARIEAMP